MKVKVSDILSCIVISALAVRVNAMPLHISPNAQDSTAITSTWNALLSMPELKGSLVGAVVADARSGKIIYARNPDLRMLPASNRKLFTSAAAVINLGLKFRFHTDVVSATPLSASGEIDGPLYLRGMGDPTLVDSDLDQMAKELFDKGLRRVNGSVVGDGSKFSTEIYGDNWGWNNLTDYSAPEITSLEVDRDVIDVTIHGGVTDGDPTTVTLKPAIPYAIIQNTSITGSDNKSGETPSDDLGGYVDRVWDKDIVLTSGSVKPNEHKTDEITLVDAPRYAALQFTSALQRAGIHVAGEPVSGVTPAHANILLLHYAGVPLSEYLPLMLKPSDNLLAEALVREEGIIHGSKGDYAAGHAYELPALRSLGVDTSTLRFNDGSGVSRRDYVPPRATIALLVGMIHRPEWRVWYQALPIAGVDGTLRKRMIGTRAQGNVHAKTGTLSETVALSGYVTDRTGRLLAFSLMANNFLASGKSVRHLHDLCVESLADGKY